MKIAVTDFKGMMPGLHPRLLPENFAVEAQNVRLDDGSLTPTREDRRVHTFGSDMVSFLKLEDEWLGFKNTVHGANGAADTSRLYVTGDGTPKIFRPGEPVLEMRLDPPDRRPTVSIESGVVDEDVATESLWTYTYVTSLGEESTPARASRLLKWSPGMVIRVGNLPSVNPNPERELTGMRIYRSITDELGQTSFFFVAEIGFQASWLDDTGENELGEVLASTDYDRPPTSMRGITSMPNGMMVAFQGNNILFCEPYIHHAWPIKYRLKVDHQIVGLGVFGSTVVIMTRGTPYIAQGTHPSTMAMEQFEVDLPCVSGRSIVDMGYAVIYASTDGLVQVNPGGANVFTSQLFKLEEWQKMQPSTFIAARKRGRYVFSHRPLPDPDEADDRPRRLGIVDTTGAQPFYITDDAAFTHLMTEKATGRMFGLFNAVGVVLWDDLNKERKLMKWRSKPIYLPTPTNFSCVRVDVDDGQNADVRVRVWAGPMDERGNLRNLVREISTRNKVERLPSGFSEELWQVEVEGYSPVSAIFLAHSPTEMAES